MKKFNSFQNAENRLPLDLKSMAPIYGLFDINTTMITTLETMVYQTDWIWHVFAVIIFAFHLTSKKLQQHNFSNLNID